MEALQFLAGLNKRALPPAESPPAQRPRAQVDAHHALVRSWVEYEANWWASPSPSSLGTPTLCSQATDFRRCYSFPLQFARKCLDDAASCGLAPLVTAWALHDIGVLPIMGWMQELRLPEETTAWGEALAQLHVRTAAMGTAGSDKFEPPPCSRLLQSMSRFLVASLAETTVSTPSAPLDADLRERLEAILHAFVSSSLLTSAGTPSMAAGSAFDRARAASSHAVFQPSTLQRCTFLLRCLRNCNLSNETHSGPFARSMLHLVCCGSAGGVDATQHSATLASLARASVHPVGDVELARALSTFVEELVLLLHRHFATALATVAAPHGTSPPSSTARLVVDPARWFHVATAAHQVSTQTALELRRELKTTAILLVTSDSAVSAACTFPLAGVLLAVGTGFEVAGSDGSEDSARSVDGYAEWMVELAKAASTAGRTNGRGGEGGTKQAVGRLTRALCEMAGMQRVASLRNHLKLAARLHKVCEAVPNACEGLRQYEDLLRARIAHLGANEQQENASEEAEAERRDASALIEAALVKLDKEGGKGVPINLARAKFLQPRQWCRHIVPMLLMSTAEPPPPCEEAQDAREQRLHRERLVARLVHLLRVQKMLPTSNPTTGCSSGTHGAASTARDATNVPTEWTGLLEALPRLAAVTEAVPTPSREVRALEAALLALEGALVPASNPDCPKPPAPASARPLLLPEDAAQHVSTLLGSLLQAFALCLQEAGVHAASKWPSLVVERVFFRPALVWPALHRALWGWLRIAVAGRAGAHERPLALLLLHLASLQRTRCAQAGCAPEHCPECDSHWAVVACSRAEGGGCQAAALLESLPISTASERAWSMRLGGACIQLACSGFEQVDTGTISPEGWAAAPSPSVTMPPGGAVRAAASSASGAVAIAGADTMAADVPGVGVKPSTTPRTRCFVPARFLRLVAWLAGRESKDGGEEAAVCELRHIMSGPAAAPLLEQARPPDGDARAEAEERWQALTLDR